MNTAAIALKRIDLLAFIAGSDGSGPAMGMNTLSGGDHAGQIRFPSFGNWINRPNASMFPGRDAALCKMLHARHAS